LSKAGIIELGASTTAFILIIAGMSIALSKNTSLGSPTAFNFTDEVCTIISEHSYMDPNSGNTYPVIDFNKNSFALQNNLTQRFPVLIFKDGNLTVGVI